MSVARNVLKALAPPLFWQAMSAVRNKGRVPLVRQYQGVTTTHNMRSLHEGPFGRVFDRAAGLDPHLHPDVTRLRNYLACFFADYAKHVPGDFLSAGISYGVAPKTIFDFIELDTVRFRRTYHLIDAFAGVEDSGA